MTGGETVAAGAAGNKKVPMLVCAEGFQTFLHTHCPVVLEKFCPTPWCWGGRMQTLVRVFIKSCPSVTYRNEMIRTGDGGQLSLDWVDNPDSANYSRSSRPTVLILPGLTGNSRQTYILHMVHQAIRHGYRCVVMNNRGFGGEELLASNSAEQLGAAQGCSREMGQEDGQNAAVRQAATAETTGSRTELNVLIGHAGFAPIRTPLTFCAANTQDVETVVNHVKALHPQAPLIGAGVSLGGMLLLNYLARKGRDSKMIAGVTMSVSWNSFESSKSLEQPINKLLFNRHLASNLCHAIKRHRKILEKVINIDHVLKARTIREFDERFTSVMFGYKSCTDYYQDASPGYKLPQMAVPILCLNAADDPFSPKHAFPVSLAQRLPNIALLVTSHGGHIGFLEGLFPHGEGYMDRVFSQFIRAAFEHQEDLKEACSGSSD